MKLNTKIIISILELAIIPLLFFGFISYFNTRAQINKNILNNLDAIAQIQQNRLQDAINQKLDILSLFTTKPLLRSYLHDFNIQPKIALQENMNTNLLQSMEGSVSIKKIFITNPAGKIVASTDKNLIDSDVSAEDYFKQGIKKSDVSILKKDDKSVIFQYLVSPVILKGKTEGMVALVVDTDDIFALANDYTGLGDTGETLLVKNDGIGNALFLTPIRFDKNAGLSRVVSKEEKNVPAIHAIAGEENTSIDFIDYRKIPVYSATRFVETINLGIVVKINKAEALAPIEKIKYLFLLLVLFISIIIIFLAIPIAKFIASKEEELDKSKDEFLLLASHQLASPITATLWGLKPIINGKRGLINEEQKETLEEIYKRTENMMDLVGGFLDLTKIESSGFEVVRGDVDLVQMSDLILGELEKQILDKKINIIKKYSSSVLHVDIGTKTARIILQNLLTNAVKYTPENGTIEVLIEKNIKGISIVVKDNGCGIPEESKIHIFSKLFRADNVKEKEPLGTGLGLYLLKSMVDKLGGKVWFESEEGKGTTFFVNLK
ncbi:MAG: ATP-binding protein [Minisyncoccia bacterium]